MMGNKIRIEHRPTTFLSSDDMTQDGQQTEESLCREQEVAKLLASQFVLGPKSSHAQIHHFIPRPGPLPCRVCQLGLRQRRSSGVNLADLPVCTFVLLHPQNLKAS